MCNAILTVNIRKVDKAFFAECFEAFDSVLFARDAAEGISMLSEELETVRCVLVDVTGDNHESFQFLNHAHEIMRRASIPCFALADRKDAEGKRQADALGVADFLYAPFDAQTLLRLLDQTVIGSRLASDRIQLLNKKDMLTGLLSKEAVACAIQEYLIGDSDNGDIHALLIIDFDGFQNINRQYGEEIGDLVLTETGKRLQMQLRESDIVGRLDGDAFVVFLKKIRNQENTLNKVEQLQQALCAPIAVRDDLVVRVSCSIGCTLGFNGSKHFSRLCSEANTALSYAKENGKNGYVVYQEGISLSVKQPESAQEVSTDGTFLDNGNAGQTHSGSELVGGDCILVADADESNRALICSALIAAGYEVVEAQDGSEVLPILHGDTSVALLILDLSMTRTDGYEILHKIRADKALCDLPVLVVTADDTEEAQAKACDLGASDYITKPYNAKIVQLRVRNLIEQRRNHLLQIEGLTMKMRLEQQEQALYAAQYDHLTGMLSGDAFTRQAMDLLSSGEPGKYVISCLDVDNFKVINDQYGRDIGDRLLCHIADIFGEGIKKIGGICARLSADNFTAIYPVKYMNSDLLQTLWDQAATLSEPFVRVELSIGHYIVNDLSLSVNTMQDRAALAKETVKGRYDAHSATYDEYMRDSILQKQEIVGQMESALRDGQFEVWLQPQFNHVNGTQIGAEALVRWRHPQKGLISPILFIPVFEQNGFIYSLDKYVWEEVCKLYTRWEKEGRKPLSVSVNVSRYDIFQPDFYDCVTGLVEKYGVPHDFLRLEITESAFAQSAAQIITVVERLRDFGFYVEIDDFGSGYSSLNILKSVPANVLKLDIRFLESDRGSHRGGRILESVIRMAKWLDMPVIAEGVETKKQADYLRSLGCEYVQGYLYAKPMPVKEYDRLDQLNDFVKHNELDIVPYLGADSFWNPDSLETMVFNRFSGGACVFEYWNGEFEMLRVNGAFKDVLRTSLSEKEILKIAPFSSLNGKKHQELIATIEHAIETGKPEIIELRSTAYATAQQHEHVRCTFRLIASNDERFLFFAYLENITAQRSAERALYQSAARLRSIMDAVGGGIAAIAENEAPPQYQYVNERFYSMFGYTKKQFNAEVTEILQRVYPADRESMQQKMAACLRNKQDIAFEFRGIKRNGDTIWIRCTATQMILDGKKTALSFFSDITAEKSAEGQLKTLIHDMPGGFMRMCFETGDLITPLYVNESFCRLLDMTEAEFLNTYGENLLSCVHPEDRDLLRRALGAAKMGEATTGFDLRLSDRNGDFVLLQSFYRFSVNPDKTVFANVYFTDASKERKLEVYRRELLERLPCGAGIYEIIGSEVCALYLNRRYSELIGRSPDEFPGFLTLNAAHPDDKEMLRGVILEAAKTGNPFSYDCRVKSGKGNYIHLRLSGSIIPTGKNRWLGYATFVKASSDEHSVLSRLNSVMSNVFSASENLAFIKDENLRYICCTRAFAHMTGLAHESEVIGKSDYDLFEKTLADRYRADDIAILKEKKAMTSFLEPLPDADGESRYVLTSKYLLVDSDGEPLCLYGTGRYLSDAEKAALTEGSERK